MNVIAQNERFLTVAATMPTAAIDAARAAVSTRSPVYMEYHAGRPLREMPGPKAREEWKRCHRLAEAYREHAAREANAAGFKPSEAWLISRVATLALEGRAS